MDMSYVSRNRSDANILMLLVGPAGAGKSFTALRLAYGISQHMKDAGIKKNPLVGVIDTEQGRSLYYRGHRLLGGWTNQFSRTAEGRLELDENNRPIPLPTFDYRTRKINGDFAPRNYVMAIQMAVKSGVDILIIDGLSAAWAGEGGMLQKHERIAKKEKNSYTAWRPVTADYHALMGAILDFPGHIICTCRAREGYELVEYQDGKKKRPERVGLKPIFRDGPDGSVFFEFTLAMMITLDHEALVEKDMTGVFDDPERPGMWNPQVLTDEHGRALASWFYDLPDGSMTPELEAEIQAEIALREQERQEEAARAAQTYQNIAAAQQGMQTGTSAQNDDLFN